MTLHGLNAGTHCILVERLKERLQEHHNEKSCCKYEREEFGSDWWDCKCPGCVETRQLIEEAAK